jgi:hypothetical protein
LAEAIIGMLNRWMMMLDLKFDAGSKKCSQIYWSLFQSLD